MKLCLYVVNYLVVVGVLYKLPDWDLCQWFITCRLPRWGRRGTYVVVSVAVLSASGVLVYILEGGEVGKLRRDHLLCVDAAVGRLVVVVAGR